MFEPPNQELMFHLKGRGDFKFPAKSYAVGHFCWSFKVKPGQRPGFTEPRRTMLYFCCSLDLSAGLAGPLWVCCGGVAGVGVAGFWESLLTVTLTLDMVFPLPETQKVF